MDEIFKTIVSEFDIMLSSNEIPVVAVIVDQENNIVSKSANNRQKNYKICGHAEIDAINFLYEKNKSKNLKGYKLYVTMEPCKMCVGAIEQTGLNEVYYFVKNNKFGGSLIAEPRIKFHKIDSELSVYIEDKLKKYFRKLR